MVINCSLFFIHICRIQTSLAVGKSPEPPLELDPCIIIEYADDATIVECCQLDGSVIATTDSRGSKLLMFNTQYVLAETKTLIQTEAVLAIVLIEWYK